MIFKNNLNNNKMFELYENSKKVYKNKSKK
jgi:hypothetical protein